ncbi:UPF0147 family protein [Candidatus Micrarchaeota archaeon]|nr:UPF0147 family protein [Candidatus Micrarchaeota archaeon]
MTEVDPHQLQTIVSLLDVMVQDNSIPRNVRARLAEAQEKLKHANDMDVAISSAVYALDEVSNDINLPMHARTMIWNLLSELESLKND